MPLPQIIEQKLDRFQRTLRLYAALDGTAAVLVAVILLFALNFALDRFFEFPIAVRYVLLPVLLGTILYILWRRILRRCFAVLRQDQLAAALEHYVPRLNETLLTVVSRKPVSREPTAMTPDNDLLIQQTIDDAVARLRSVNVRRFFRTGQIIARLLFALICVAVTAGACAYHSETVSLWFARNIMLAEQEYPRRSQLLVEGFQDGQVRIGRGDSFTLTIRANADMTMVPETIRVRIGTAEFGYRTLLLDQFRTETREGTRWRLFSVSFPEMLETAHLHIRGADSTLSGLLIEVVPTPTLTDMMLTQHFPKYMQRPARTTPMSGRTMVPDGSTITITATPTKPLIAVTAASAPTLPSLHVGLDGMTLENLREETVIDFHLTDTDGLTNRHPIRVELGIIPDRPPIVTARLQGVGPAITPQAVLPLVGEITDDNGLTYAVMRYETEHNNEKNATEGATPITGIMPGQTVFPLSQTFAVASTGVQPGDKLVLHIEANDAFDLDGDDTKGQTGSGQRWTLDIVTPEQLKTLLETREITLRQRFEIIIGEVERTKNILLDFALEPTETQIQKAAALLLETIEEETEENREYRQRELNAQKQRILDTITPEQSDLGKFHISRMLRDTYKEVYDITNIVESFRTIRAEMLNNRIFTEDERRRIDLDIMQPMQTLTGSDFPEMDALLGKLEQLLSQREVPNRLEALEERYRVLAKFDDVLYKMSAIRDSMVSMESFNEVLELLRSIIRQQQILRNETLEEQRRRLRNLL